MLLEFIYEYFLKIVAGYLLADFFAGVYHWVKDSYFGPFTPILGSTFIWGSRLHHIRPRYVVEFNDWQLFWGSAKWAAIWVLPLLFLTRFDNMIISFFITMSLNDVVHKYAHMMDYERPYWASFLQKMKIFQSHEEHHLHHIDPHVINYCPISPFVNDVLEWFNFWRKLEKLVYNVTGIQARSKEYDFVEDENYPAGIKFIEE